VRDLMQTAVYTCGTDAALSDAAKIMWDHDCGSVPVVDADGRVRSMLTDRDVCMAAFLTDLPLSRASVTNAMSKVLHACRPEDTVAYAEELMQLHQIHRLPVISDKGELVGILSLGDVARYVGTHAAAEDGGVTPKSLAETLASISQTRGDFPPRSHG
jgi:CBS domain-containing protein